MTLLVPGCEMLSFPSHLLPLLLDGWESREYLWLPLSKDQVWVRNWLMWPSPQRCCTRDSRARWGVSLSSLNMCFEGLAYFFPTIPSALKEMVWWLVVHLTLHLIFIQIPWNIPPNVFFILVFSKVMKRTGHKNQSPRRKISCSFFPFNLLEVPTSE